MANEIRSKFDATAALTITLTAVGAGAGRAGTLVNNTVLQRPGSLVHADITITGGAAGDVIEFYLLRKDAHASPITTDNFGGTDAAWTQVSAKLLGRLTATGAGAHLYGDFDTRFLGELGPYWTIGVTNNGSGTISAGTIHCTPYVSEVQ